MQVLGTIHSGGRTSPLQSLLLAVFYALCHGFRRRFTPVGERVNDSKLKLLDVYLPIWSLNAAIQEGELNDTEENIFSLIFLSIFHRFFDHLLEQIGT